MGQANITRSDLFLTLIREWFQKFIDFRSPPVNLGVGLEQFSSALTDSLSLVGKMPSRCQALDTHGVSQVPFNAGFVRSQELAKGRL